MRTILGKLLTLHRLNFRYNKGFGGGVPTTLLRYGDFPFGEDDSGNSILTILTKRVGDMGLVPRTPLLDSGDHPRVVTIPTGRGELSKKLNPNVSLADP